MTEFRWVEKKKPDEHVLNSLCKAINVSRPVGTILVQRGINDYVEAKHFFRPKLNMLHDPFLMKDMDKAVTRMIQAFDNNEKILVYGDYDVDGTTSVAMFFGAINAFHAKSNFYIPDRYKEGYGISKAGIDWASDHGYSLIVALDCGIKSVGLIAYAKGLGIDFIICDHHTPGNNVPEAIAVLDPKQPDCEYPYKELPGCGIGFKLLQALADNYLKANIDPLQYIDLVAVSIASDIVPIDGENRILAFYGLKKLKEAPSPGLKALIKLAGIKDDITISGVVFGIAPRINASGRITHAKTAVNMLLAETEEEAYHYGDELNLKNRKRKDFDATITAEAIKMIEANELMETSKTTVLFKDNWHKGVIGIVASRCIEQYYRPTIILTESNAKATGSARSVPGFDVYEAISACSELLEQFGGHKYAAGLTLDLDKVADFQTMFEKVVASTISEELLIPQIEIDTVLGLDKITPNFFKVIQQIGPFGPGNLKPVFTSADAFSVSAPKVIKSKHLKFTVGQKGNKRKFEAIGFNLAKYKDKLKNGQLFKMAYTIEENNYKGLRSIQLNVKDLKFE